MLAPDFARMPAPLRRVPRWVCHKAKVPFDPAALRRKASVTDPSTWGSFDQAQAAYEESEGNRDGVGLVLAGDGIVGVDLDHVVHDGAPDPAAMALLDRIGCQFIELSPSGTGLHGWGYGPNIGGRRGKLDGLNVEMYSQGRYLTMTGRPLKDGPLVELPGFASVADALKASTPTPQRHQNDTLLSSVDSVVSAVSVGLDCSATVPLHEGDRNRCLFELARRLKAANPDATEAERRSLVLAWHKAHYAVIRTKAFSVSWDDFERAWSSVRVLPGQTMARLLEAAKDHQALPPELIAKGYGPQEGILFHVCAALQAHAGTEPFFISSRTAAELLGHTDHKSAAAMLRSFVRDGVLDLVSRGAVRTASRYRLAQPKGGRA